jgi:hypothetical protein
VQKPWSPRRVKKCRVFDWALFLCAATHAMGRSGSMVASSLRCRCLYRLRCTRAQADLPGKENAPAVNGHLAVGKLAAIVARRRRSRDGCATGRWQRVLAVGRQAPAVGSKNRVAFWSAFTRDEPRRAVGNTDKERRASGPGPARTNPASRSPPTAHAEGLHFPRLTRRDAFFP